MGAGLRLACGRFTSALRTLIQIRGYAKACVVSAVTEKQRDAGTAKPCDAPTRVVAATTGQPIADVAVLASEPDPVAMPLAAYPPWLAEEVARPRSWAQAVGISGDLVAAHGANASLVLRPDGLLHRRSSRLGGAALVARIRSGAVDVPSRSAVRWASRQRIASQNDARRKR